MRHQAAFANQITSLLSLKKSDIFLDCTLGDGTHTEEALRLGCQVISFDLDPEAIKRSKKFIDKKLHKKWQAYQTNFSFAADIFSKYKLDRPTAVLMDLGTSQYQLTNLNRGFSFNSNTLDMRMDPKLSVTAADLVNALSKPELIKLFRQLGDLSQIKANRITTAIIKHRNSKPITSGRTLAELIKQLYPARNKIHPATTVFQALRMAVNLERSNLSQALINIFDLLAKNGRFAIISFHSGEDRLVKRFFNNLKSQKQAKLLHKLLTPTNKELQINPKIRSAKLRVIQKIQ
jgi:16S rRNA (cytosine1402-N4)-methyltransferase